MKKARRMIRTDDEDEDADEDEVRTRIGDD